MVVKWYCHIHMIGYSVYLDGSPETVTQILHMAKNVAKRTETIHTKGALFTVSGRWPWRDLRQERSSRDAAATPPQILQPARRALV